MKRIQKIIVVLTLVIGLIIAPITIAAAGPNYWVFDNGIEFDGVDQRLEIPTWSPGASDFTIEFWFNQRDQQGLDYLVTADTANSNGSFYIRTVTDQDDLAFRIQDDTGNLEAINTTFVDVQDGEWHHYAVVVDRGNDLAHVYIDGETERPNYDISAITDDITIEDANTQLGSTNIPNNWDSVYFADYRTWSDVRTPAEIADNMYSVLVGDEANLERYYTFDDGTGTTVTDYSHGGIFENGVAFDGVDQYMQFSSYSPVASDFTIEYWFRQNDPGGNEYLLCADPVSSNGSYLTKASTDNDDLISKIEDDSGNEVNITTASAGVQDGQWHHVAWVLDRGNDLSHVYIDGIVNRDSVDISALVDTVTIGAANMTLSSSTGPGAYNTMDYIEYRIWSDVRSPAEIADNMYSVLVGDEANLERYYTFDDGTGTTVTDMVSGGSNDGTLVNGPTWDAPAGNLFNTPTWIEPIPVTMGNSSVSVPSGIEDAIELSLNESYRPDSELEINPNYLPNMWAVTSYTESETSDYYWVSLTGMVVEDTAELDDWDMSLSMWAGVAIAEDTVDPDYEAYVEGDSNYTTMIDAASLPDIAHPDIGGTGSATYYFPWAAGYEAYYGVKGVHADVGPPGSNYGGNGWLAVDWVGGATGYSAEIYPNAAYVSQSGKVSFRCEDDVQAWVQIGNFLYGHLVDNATLEEGVYHSQGSYLGALVTGSHIWKQSQCTSADPDAISSGVKCGITCQRDTSYHLHWGFLPDSGYFQTENWVLNTSTEYWNKGVTYIGPGNYMLAEWANRPIVPTPGPTVTPGGPTVTPDPNIIYDEGGGSGSNFWDGVIAGIVKGAKGRAEDINDLSETGDNMYQDRGIVTTAASGIRIAIRTVYVLLVSNLNMTISMIVLTLIFILEPIRLVRAAWLAIKEMIPFIG